MSERKRHRVDGNQVEIRKALERIGYLFIDTSQTNLGFDGLVVKAGRIVPIEIKHPKRLALTPNEQDAHAKLKAYGVRVEVLTGVDQSLDVLMGDQRQVTRNFYKREEKS